MARSRRSFFEIPEYLKPLVEVVIDGFNESQISCEDMLQYMLHNNDPNGWVHYYAYTFIIPVAKGERIEVVKDLSDLFAYVLTGYIIDTFREKTTDITRIAEKEVLMQDVNHQVSKALVKSNPKHTLFVLEDLSGVRNATERVRTKDRYVSVSWPFYDLERKLIYKAKQNQSAVIKVDPRYTSQCCPVCGHIEKANRNKKIHLFTCKNCGYKSNDDRIGAMNLYRMGINYLEDSQVPDTVTAE